MSDSEGPEISFDQQPLGPVKSGEGQKTALPQGAEARSGQSGGNVSETARERVRKLEDELRETTDSAKRNKLMGEISDARADAGMGIPTGTGTARKKPDGGWG